MKPILRVLSALALLGTIVPPSLFLGGRIDLAATQLWMTVAAVVWFASTPFWMEQEKGGA
jgi:hypothetical protein